VFQYKVMHFGQYLGNTGLLGIQLCPHRRHFSVGNFMSFIVLTTT
jgi:hypothetical protein